MADEDKTIDAEQTTPEEIRSSAEILAENPEIQEYVADLSGAKVEQAVAEFEEKAKAEVETPVPAPAPVPAPKTPQKAKYAEPKAVTLDDITASQPVPAGPAVVGNGEVDDVQLGKIVYKNLYARKSLSVHHMQRRLAELGYDEALNDKDGFYGDHTKRALSRFQAANKLDGAGMVDADSLTLLFTGDPNVNLVL